MEGHCLGTHFSVVVAAPGDLHTITPEAGAKYLEHLTLQDGSVMPLSTNPCLQSSRPPAGITPNPSLTGHTAQDRHPSQSHPPCCRSLHECLLRYQSWSHDFAPAPPMTQVAGHEQD